VTGTLIIVGSGIKAVGHLTADAIHWIRSADKVLHVVADAVTEQAIREMSPSAESMKTLYSPDRRRRATYEAMVERILREVRTGRLVCAVFYGHPGVFVLPSHEAIRRAREEGHPALMLPGISAEDCLIADLGLDPARIGWQSFEATDFLIYHRGFDPAAGMVLWQIGAIGNLGLQKDGFHRHGLGLLVNVLAATYGLDHEVIVYEAAVMPTCDPVIHRAPLRHLLDAPITTLSTMYVPPCRRAPLDLEMVSALGLSPSDFGHA
jgi:precorrin-6B methylase 1